MNDLIDWARASNLAQLTILQHGATLVDTRPNPAPVDVYAVQKGIVALLLGIAQEQYLLEISDPVNHHVDPEWTRIGPWQEARLTIEILMQMTTGMNDDLEPEGEIGTTWRYNNVAYQQLKKILCLHTGRTLDDLSRDWLFDRVGMTDTRWFDRDLRLPDGTPLSAMASTAADLARLGEAVRNGGGAFTSERWYLDEIRKPGSAENPAWGLLWWNNDQAHFKVPASERTFEGPAIATAPGDLIAARGARGNHLGISRDTGLVVAATVNQTGDVSRTLERDLWQAVTRHLGIEVDPA